MLILMENKKNEREKNEILTEQNTDQMGNFISQMNGHIFPVTSILPLN